MKRYSTVAAITAVCFGPFCSIPAVTNRAQAQGTKAAASAMPKINVFNPLGTPPPDAKAPDSGANPPPPDAKSPAARSKMPGMGFSNVSIIVNGGSNNNYFSIGGLRYMQSVRIDKWR